MDMVIYFNAGSVAAQVNNDCSYLDMEISVKKINKIRRKENILTHFIPLDSSTIICWTSPFVILGGVGSVLSLSFYF